MLRYWNSGYGVAALKRLTVIGLSTCVLLAICRVGASAQSASARGPGLVFQSRSATSTSGFKPEVVKPDKPTPFDQFLQPNGKQEPMDQREWMATIKTVSQDSRFFCTATLIGPRVLLTAAHCTSHISEAVIDITPDARRLKCQAHPRFRPVGLGFQFDYALCLLDKDYPEAVLPIAAADKAPSSVAIPVKFERLSLDPRDVKFSFSDSSLRYLLLAGFGCTKRDQTRADPKQNVLSAGFTRITAFGPVRLTSGGRSMRDSAILCAGDSGGAAYRVRNPTDPFGERVIVAINSANIVQNSQVGDFSYLPKTSAPAFVSFFWQWKRAMGNPMVCGVDPAIAQRCH
jgi:hypothetical protein